MKATAKCLRWLWYQLEMQNEDKNWQPWAWNTTIQDEIGFLTKHQGFQDLINDVSHRFYHC